MTASVSPAARAIVRFEDSSLGEHADAAADDPRLTDLAESVSQPAVSHPTFDLHSPELYLNRELTWLEFNRRVLHEAEDERTPLLERLKFIAIVSSKQ